MPLSKRHAFSVFKQGENVFYLLNTINFLKKIIL